MLAEVCLRHFSEQVKFQVRLMLLKQFRDRHFFNYIKSVQTAFSDAQNALIERKKTEEIYFSDGKRLDALIHLL
ncbi:MAG: hypothetical protein MZV64_41505 [Ignavibacteriales bacterium]|nr:hypothetical protein [Ignavibacteriales bacterium]